MELDIVRRFRGNLHGSIDISKIEDLIIAHRAFQRLRRIKQTAFLGLVFPGASHSRFEHSLGVLHGASVAWKKLKDNQARLERASHSYAKFSHRELEGRQGKHGILAPTFEMMDQIFGSSYIYQALRIAALMHDVGHPPFSHSGERFLAPYGQLLNQLPDNCPAYLKNFIQNQPADKKSRHEIFTFLLVEKVLGDIYKDHQDLSLKIDPQDVLSILCPQIAPSEESPLISLGVNTLCHELVSGEIDIDRMDYLLRDSKECGVVYGMFDVDRIMDSLSIYYDNHQKSLHLAIQYSGLAAFEDYLRARQSMYVQLYFHKTSVAAEAMLSYVAKHLEGWTLPCDVNEFLAYDEYTFMDKLKENIQREKLPEEKKNYLIEILENLLFHRKLWKRIYEISLHGNENIGSELATARQLLQDLKVPFEQVSSSVTLTNFKIRQQGGYSCNYLRLIKKDRKQFPRVVPVEDYSPMIKPGQSLEITRIYVDHDSGSTANKEQVKEALLEAFH